MYLKSFRNFPKKREGLYDYNHEVVTVCLRVSTQILCNLIDSDNKEQ